MVWALRSVNSDIVSQEGEWYRFLIHLPTHSLTLITEGARILAASNPNVPTFSDTTLYKPLNIHSFVRSVHR